MTDRKRSTIAAVVGILLQVMALKASAHEYWVDVDSWRPVTPTNITVKVRGGHYFPKSSFAVADRALQGVACHGPGGATTIVATTEAGKERRGTVALNSDGVSILCATLKRPRAKTPAYEAKAILISANGPDEPARYALGRGLELVPMSSLNAVRPGSVLPLVLMLDGERIAGSIEAIADGGKPSFLKADDNRPAELRIAKAGGYLLTAHINGRGCSLTFRVGELQEGAP